MPVRRVLLVDDEPYMTSLVAQKLQRLGYQTVTARNGAEGLAAALQSPPDLIITDYQMPAMDGMEMAVRLRAAAQTRDVPVIMLSARGHRITPTELQATGIRAIVEKPFSLKDLTARIEELIGPPTTEAAA